MTQTSPGGGVSARSRALLWAALPLLVLIPLLLWLGRNFAGQLAAEQRDRTQQTLTLHAAAVQRSLDRIEGKLESLAVFVAGETAEGQTVDAAQFGTFAAGLHASSTWIRAFQIVSDGVITHTYPVRGNEAVLGYNLLADPRPVIGGDVVRAQQTGRVTITGPLPLVQGGLGLILRRPLPRPTGAPARLVAIVLNLAPLLAEAGIGNEAASDVQFALRRDPGDVFFGSAAVFDRQPVTRRLSLPDGAWVIGGIPRGGWQVTLGAPLLAFYLAGAAVVFLLCALVFVFAQSRANLTETVRAQTESLRLELAARQRVEEVLRESERQLSRILNNVSDVIFAIAMEPGDNFRFTSVNRRFLEATGLPESKIVGALVRDVLPESSQAIALPNYREAIRSGQPAQWDEIADYPAGRKIGHVTVVPVVDEHGGCTQLVGLVHDITERKQSEQAIRDLNASLERRVAERTEELAQAKERAEAADRVKSSFLATMSHELRTPLNSIIGFTGIMLQGLAGPLNPEQTKQLEIVWTSARHLLALINDVLDISKIEAAQLDVAREPVAVRAVVDKVVALVRPMAEKKGLAFRTELAPGVDTVISDQRRVEQVLLNLLTNAIKFTERGEVTLRTWAGQEGAVPEARNSPAAAARPPDAARQVLRFQISDTGIGIQPENLATLFQPFRQIDSGLTRQHEGTGLGLAICRRLAHLMGGEISVESVWGKGSVFTFTLHLHGPKPS